MCSRVSVRKCSVAVSTPLGRQTGDDRSSDGHNPDPQHHETIVRSHTGPYGAGNDFTQRGTPVEGKQKLPELLAVGCWCRLPLTPQLNTEVIRRHTPLIKSQS